MIRALLWDVDGTLAETERDGHRVAFNLAFEAEGLPWHWDDARYGELLRVIGGRERLRADLATRPDAPADLAERERLVVALHVRKNRFYADLVGCGMPPLREGVAALMDEALVRGVPMGLATTTSRVNVDPLLASRLGTAWADRFATVVCGEDVRAKKPDPEAYLRALAALGVSPPDTLALEDSPGGVAAARAAAVPVAVTRSHYFAQAQFDGALAIGPGLHTVRGWMPAIATGEAGDRRVTLDDLDAWHAAWGPARGRGSGLEIRAQPDCEA